MIKDGWISVKDELPESDTTILVLLLGKHVRISYYFNDSLGEWFSEYDDPWDKYYGCGPSDRKAHDEESKFVTHWMPLPELPKTSLQTNSK